MCNGKLHRHQKIRNKNQNTIFGVQRKTPSTQKNRSGLSPRNGTLQMFIRKLYLSKTVTVTCTSGSITCLVVLASMQLLASYPLDVGVWRAVCHTSYRNSTTGIRWYDALSANSCSRNHFFVTHCTFH